jgi:hypothetical protein
VLLLAATLLAAPASARGEPRADSFDYLHVEANEGSASGGHVAIRFGGETFHFQLDEDGILRLHRDDSDAFLRTYAGLSNRDVHVQRIRVAPETARALRSHFNDRFLLEERQFAVLAGLRADRELLAALADERAGAPSPTVAVPGAAFFVAAGDHTRGAPASSALAALRGRVLATHGAELVRRDAATREALARLPSELPDPAHAIPPAGSPHDHPDAPPSLAQRAAELLAAETALDVLLRGATFRADRARSLALRETVLDKHDVAALARHAAALETRLVALATSSRPDWGGAMLLGMARLAAIAGSLEGGRLVVLDAYPEDAASISPEEVVSHAAVLPDLLADARADLVDARRALRVEGAPSEAAYTALESAANRYLELHQATRSGTRLRLAAGPLLPSGSERRPLALAHALSAERLRARLNAATEAAERYEAHLRALYGYDLVRRNCVSEIFREIAAALDVAPAVDERDVCATSRERLGGCVDPARGLHFVPFLSARAVGREYRVDSAHELPSYRHARLAEMYAKENDLRVFLRESNVLTSTVYERNGEDSAFLFFTDDATLPRPLFGALNLATAVGAGIAGLVMLPAGDADLLVAGLRGALFSLPELAFVSLRKGSFAYVPRARAAAATRPETAPAAAEDARPSRVSSSGPAVAPADPVSRRPPAA